MEGLVQPDRLRTRILMWAQEEARMNALPAQAANILEAILYRGELPRGEAAGLLGVTARHARRIVAALVDRGVLLADGAREPLRLTFPAALASRWLPGLFPEPTS
jgi:DNA-binding Lrp family transcriptional regulator